MHTAQHTQPRTEKANDRRSKQGERISEKRVRELLLGIAYSLHTTRVVGWKGGIAPKKG